MAVLFFLLLKGFGKPKPLFLFEIFAGEHLESEKRAADYGKHGGHKNVEDVLACVGRSCADKRRSVDVERVDELNDLVARAFVGYEHGGNLKYCAYDRRSKGSGKVEKNTNTHILGDRCDERYKSRDSKVNYHIEAEGSHKVSEISRSKGLGAIGEEHKGNSESNKTVDEHKTAHNGCGGKRVRNEYGIS